MNTFYCDSIQQLPEAAKFIIENSGSQRIWIFEGRMGAGKTTVIKAIAAEFSIEDNVSSPTFSVINEYQNSSGEIFYHFDCYRIDDPSEALDIGVEEYFYSGHYCWVEWAEKIRGFIPDEYLLIKIEEEDKGRRIISLNQINNGA